MKDVKDAKDDEKEEVGAASSKVKNDEPDESFTSILASKPYNSDYEIQVCMHVCIHTQTHIHTHTNLIHACIHI